MPNQKAELELKTLELIVDASKYEAEYWDWMREKAKQEAKKAGIELEIAQLKFKAEQAKMGILVEA